jgi:hypothetical protein
MAAPRSFAVAASLVLLACSKKAANEKPPREKLLAGGVTWEVVEGSWRVDQGALVSSGGRVQAQRDLSDGSLELDAEQDPSSPSGAGTIGIGFRYSLLNDDPSRANGYLLSLQGGGPAGGGPGGSFTVSRVANSYAQPVSPDLRGLQHTGLLDPRKNHIVIHMAGNSFRIDVNGESLLAFTDPSYERGGVGLSVQASASTVRFTNVRFVSR